MARPPIFLNPEYPGSGYQRSPSSRGFSIPAKVEAVQVPDETGAGPVAHEAIFASVTAVEGCASIPAVPVEYFVESGPV